ncbi:glycosyltransferase [Anthocerotibacter panamensis]|uniref:glycosyltransferase n=1 Tax=Anthocerotibacter panamensis TaxID=2857077 RepID=UPI001C40681F|nr:glycosyltransferase [Anthocerotibacter panamensis]
MPPNLVVFSSLLLPPSQTFIQAQGERLTRFTPYYVGSRQVQGLALPPERTLVVNRGGPLGLLQEVGFKALGWAPGLGSRLRQMEPCLIHAHFGLGGALALPLAQRLGVPLVVTYHGADATARSAPYSWSHHLYRQRHQTLVREACLFIAVSRFIYRTLLAGGFPTEKIVQHYIGVDTQKFCPADRAARVPYVLCVGRHTPKKGLDTLLRAFARLAVQFSDIHLFQVGTGELTAVLKALAAHLGIAERVHFLGSQPPQVVLRLMQGARLFALASQQAADGDSEGLGMVFLEASACGIPVVATWHGGIPEAVVAGETGLLAPEGDDAALAEHIAHLLSDRTRAQQMGVRGREYVCECFDLHKQSQVLEQIYAGLPTWSPSRNIALSY